MKTNYHQRVGYSLIYLLIQTLLKYMVWLCNNHHLTQLKGTCAYGGWSVFTEKHTLDVIATSLRNSYMYKCILLSKHLFQTNRHFASCTTLKRQSVSVIKVDVTCG